MSSTMRRGTIFTAVWATHQGADAPFPEISVRIHATSDADGSNPHGVMRILSPALGQRRVGEVTCLDVRGHVATIGIRFVRAEDPTLVGQGELFRVADDHHGIDQIAGFPVTATAPTECPSLDFGVPLVAGNYRVADATP